MSRFNSESARKLANDNGILLKDISTHRLDKKITLKDVECILLRRRSNYDSKSYSSETAKKLASSNGLTLNRVKSHRPDGKITINNVKCAMLSNQASGYFVELYVKPYGLGERVTLGYNNIMALKRWFSIHSQSAAYVVNISKVKVLVVPDPDVKKSYILKIEYYLNDAARSEIDEANNYIIDPDDDGNYPIWIKGTKITSIDRNNRNGGDESTLVSARILSTRVTKINNNNSFGKYGKNNGVGMRGNRIPFKKI
jgi:hypothetical protein